MIELTDRHANIPKVIAANYTNYLKKLPNWIVEDFVGYLTVILVRAWQRYDPNNGAALETYLWASVKLAARGYWEKFRQQKRSGLLAERTTPIDWIQKDFRDNQHELIEAKDICKTLEDRLPAEQWQLLKLYYMEGKPLREIVKNVSGYLALKQLRQAEKAARRIIHRRVM